MRVVLAALCFIAIAAPAAAQETAPTPGVLDQVYACADIANEAERLACYDGAVGRLREAQTSGNLVAVDRAQAAELDRDAFGFSLPSLSRIFGGGRDGGGPSVGRPVTGFETIDEMQLTIASVRRTRYGPATFTMTNGMVWVQIDDEVARNAREGGTVTVRRASMGSFLMSVDAGGPAIRVRRQQ